MSTFTEMLYMKHITIREANIDQARLLAEMGARMFAASFGAYNSPEDMQSYLEKSFNQAAIHAELQSGSTKYLQVIFSEKVIGYAKVYPNAPPIDLDCTKPVELGRIYIDLNYANRGYGSQLLAACLRTAKELGGDTLWLGVWERNEQAIRFYKRWGFEIVGEMEFVLGADVQNDYVMARGIGRSS